MLKKFLPFMKRERGNHLPPKKTKRRLSKWGNSHYVGSWRLIPWLKQTANVRNAPKAQ